jgi:hypothetical protein
MRGSFGFHGWGLSSLVLMDPDSDLSLPCILLAGVEDCYRLLEDVFGGDVLLLGCVLAIVLLLEICLDLLPELEQEELDLDLFLPPPAGSRSAEAAVNELLLLEDGVGSTAGVLSIGGKYSYGGA